MRFAREGIEPITEGAIDSLDVSGTGLGNEVAQSGTNLNGEELSMLIPVGERFVSSTLLVGPPAEVVPASLNGPGDDTHARGWLGSRATHRYTTSMHGLASV